MSLNTLSIINKHVNLSSEKNYRFCEVLQEMTRKARFDDAYTVWERMHMEPTAPLDARAFTIMMRHCSMQAKVERAFFYIDEMRSLNIEPTLELCHALLHASAHAPHWVDNTCSLYTF